MKKPVLVANWKMEMDGTATSGFFRSLIASNSEILREISAIICPPFTSIPTAIDFKNNIDVSIGGQNIHYDEDISHTGEISAKLLKSTGASHVMIGHWERREHFLETDQIANLKTIVALKHDLIPLILVGESEHVERQHARDEVISRLETITKNLDASEISSCIYIYEPQSAIGQKGILPLEHVRLGALAIREFIKFHASERASRETTVIYGGSIMPESAEQLVQIQELDGLGLGRAGRNPETFVAIGKILLGGRA